MGRKNKVNGTRKVLAKSKLKMKKASKSSTASRYVTRNEALNKLQLECTFRRLCILKDTSFANEEESERTRQNVLSRKTSHS